MAGNKVELADGKRNPLHIGSNPVTSEPILVTENVHRIHGKFASAIRTTAGTTVIASPSLGQEIVMTDLIISTDRTNNATVTVQWTDGVETIAIYSGITNDAPINFGIAFAGRWSGWKDARLEMVTVGNVTANVSVGFYKLPEGLTFAEWDADR